MVLVGQGEPSWADQLWRPEAPCALYTKCTTQAHSLGLSCLQSHRGNSTAPLRAAVRLHLRYLPRDALQEGSLEQQQHQEQEVAAACRHPSLKLHRHYLDNRPDHPTHQDLSTAADWASRPRQQVHPHQAHRDPPSWASAASAVATARQLPLRSDETLVTLLARLHVRVSLPPPPATTMAP